jgi:uncharacterized protein (TIGR00251 family)
VKRRVQVASGRWIDSAAISLATAATMKKIEDLSDGRVAFTLSLVPRASRDDVVGWAQGRLRVRITAAPVAEAANHRLIAFLSKFLGIRKSEMAIVAGAHSRTKRIAVPAGCKNRLSSIEDI